MAFSASDVIPLSQARANFSELADQVKAGAEKIITKNGENYVAIIDAQPPMATQIPPGMATSNSST